MEQQAKNPKAQAPETTEKAYNELVQIRRDKLSALQEAGNDPFWKTSWPQDAYSAQLKEKYDYLQPEEVPGRSTLDNLDLSYPVFL